MSPVSSPYLKPGRLGEVLAAIQVMAVSDQYRRTLEQWTYYLSGIRAPKSQSEPDSDFEADSESEPASEPDAERAAGRWRIVFDEHPEFFRPSFARPGAYALVLRRGSPRRFDLNQRKVISETELAQIPKAERRVTRAPLAPADMKVLLDVALSLHREASERKAERRLKLQVWVPFLGSLTGGLIGVLGSLLFKTH
jgi:hypothetical protein